MKPILEVQSVSKQFLISHQGPSYLSLRDKLSGLFKSSQKSERFLALDNVSFEVQEGQSYGIIGKNGAGKSTLLKILSRITPPSKGRVITRGRIASLLEVGTGFHQELSGRENIFMNGSIMGMRKTEIERRFDEIVEFSGVEKFLDTPLKHYSSGMQLRLAFAVAAHLEPEILIIDEVLAVGDSEFQRKCLGKMEQVTRDKGRTILFVSHNLGIVNQLCQKTVWLSDGRIQENGDTSTVINNYLFQNQVKGGQIANIELGSGLVVTNLTIEPKIIKSFEDVTIRFSLFTRNQDASINSIGVFISSESKERLAIIDLRKGVYLIRQGSELIFEVDVTKISLIEGQYYLGLFIGSNLVSGNFDDLVHFTVPRLIRDELIIPYPVEVRGKIELEYEFHSKEAKRRI
jgi:ABC-type polysaccharide/polyol phosphate transport system ATPase subunit